MKPGYKARFADRGSRAFWKTRGKGTGTVKNIDVGGGSWGIGPDSDMVWLQVGWEGGQVTWELRRDLELGQVTWENG